MGKARSAAECRRQIQRLEQIDLDTFVGAERKRIVKRLAKARLRLAALADRRRR